MPTARELLEQADALMRRNRMPASEIRRHEADIPVLTEVIEAPDAASGKSAQPKLEAAAASDGSGPWRRPDATSTSPDVALDDVPVLTDVVEEIEAPTIADSIDDDEPSQWEIDRDRAARAAAAQDLAPIETAEPPAAADDSSAAMPSDDVDELALDELEAPSAPPSDAASAAHADDSAPAVATDRQRATATADDDDEHWEALAEEIRIQVLQRIDMFTDTGLHEQLSARLRPIVDRASAELVATINQQVGQLLRAYVAEAVEREIDKWRHGGG
jgi:hypothetical protein